MKKTRPSIEFDMNKLYSGLQAESWTSAARHIDVPEGFERNRRVDDAVVELIKNIEASYRK